MADYPGDIIAGAPLKRVQSPDDVVKIKYVVRVCVVSVRLVHRLASFVIGA